ncbi:hypothetical protein [Advenella kashmirensis]|nr:hypothetical protein [Advenella kashmirensis]
MTDTQALAERRRNNKRDLDAFRRKRDAEIKAAVQKLEEMYAFLKVTLDIDTLKKIAAQQTLHVNQLVKENEELVEKLNKFHKDHHYVTAAHVPPHIKRNIARMSLEFDKGPSMSSAFMAGMDVQKSLAGSKAAAKRLLNDPKQEEKKFIYECWKEWKKNSINYKSKAAFARDMIEKCEYLTSTKKIEDWCREWEKETTTQPAQ